MDPAPGFESNLRSALEAMPARWRMLHLCPGWRWGREIRRRSLAFRLRRTLSSWGWLRWDAGFTSTVPTNRLHLDATRRLIVNLQELGRTRQLRQVGGPIAFAAPREALREIVHEYDAAWHRANHSVNNNKTRQHNNHPFPSHFQTRITMYKTTQIKRYNYLSTPTQKAKH